MRLGRLRFGWRLAMPIVAVCVAVNWGSVAHGQNTQRGAVLGGLGGAIAGAVIGDHNRNAGAGAAIGGALGAVGGAVLGSARDQEISQQRQYQYQVQQHHVYAQQQQQLAHTQAAVSVGDIISMTRSGLSDSVIINQIQARGVQHQLQVSDIISLHQQGVREPVITAMQNGRVGPPVAAPAPVIVQQSPVVIEERYVVPRYSPPPVYYYHYHRGHRYGF